jgi:hypothetical protein
LKRTLKLFNNLFTPYSCSILFPAVAPVCDTSRCKIQLSLQIPLKRQFTGDSVFLYWIGKPFRSSSYLIAEDVRHLGYDMQIRKGLSTFRWIGELSSSGSCTKANREEKKWPSALLWFLVFDYETSVNIQRDSKIFIHFRTSIFPDIYMVCE